MTKESGRSPKGSGYSAEPEPEEVSAVPVSIPNAERSDDWKAGYAAGCAWYADYVQRIAAIRDRAYWEWPHGDAGDALDFACDHCPVIHGNEPIEFLEDWRAGLAEEWPNYIRWLKVQHDGAKASAIEARRVETERLDAKHESAVVATSDETPNLSPKDSPGISTPIRGEPDYGP